MFTYCLKQFWLNLSKLALFVLALFCLHRFWLYFSFEIWGIKQFDHFSQEHLLTQFLPPPLPFSSDFLSLVIFSKSAKWGSSQQNGVGVASDVGGRGAGIFHEFYRKSFCQENSMGPI